MVLEEKMSPKTIFNDFHYFVGTLLFGLFALVLVSAPGGGWSVASALIRVAVSGLLLILSVYVFRVGDAGRASQQLVRQPVTVKTAIRRAPVSSVRKTGTSAA
jgi:hypothetical protein